MILVNDLCRCHLLLFLFFFFHHSGVSTSDPEMLVNVSNVIIIGLQDNNTKSLSSRRMEQRQLFTSQKFKEI